MDTKYMRIDDFLRIGVYGKEILELNYFFALNSFKFNET